MLWLSLCNLNFHFSNHCWYSVPSCSLTTEMFLWNTWILPPPTYSALTPPRVCLCCVLISLGVYIFLESRDQCLVFFLHLSTFLCFFVLRLNLKLFPLHLQLCSRFHMDSRNPNSDPHACMAVSLHNEPLPQFLVSFFGFLVLNGTWTRLSGVGILRQGLM